MKKLFILLSLILLLFSCKKDKLEGDKAIFIGKWEWIYSTHTYSFCDGDPNTTEIITPETSGSNYSMEFLEKGIVKFHENGVFVDKKRIVFSLYKDLVDSFDFGINLNNDKTLTEILNGYIKTDTIIINAGFPYDAYDEHCEFYASYFAKQ